MRILLGTYRLLDLGGTEMWTKTMHDTLTQQHEVHVFAKMGNTLFPEMQDFDSDLRYDLAIINHHETMRALRKARLDRIIMNVHGTRPALEWPVLGADAYVAVSTWEKTFIPVPSTVIHNPIDADRFTCAQPVSHELTKVGMVSNYATPAHDITKEACRLLGLELRTVGMMGSHGASSRPEDLMCWADLVVGVNRTALEALACGRNVYLMGLWGAGGMVTEENFSERGLTNWSGAEIGAWPTPQQMAEELLAGYDPVRNLRDKIVQGHDPSRVTEAYLELAASIPRGRRLLTRLLRRLPEPVMSPTAMTYLDPLLREVTGRRPIDGRPGVLSQPWRSGR